MDNNELYHYGVLGMKWGIRRTPFQLGHQIKARRAEKKRNDNLAKARKKQAERRDLMKKGKIKPKDMTDAELKKHIDRLELEKKYIDAKNSVSSQNKGKTFASKYGGQLVDKLISQVGIDLAVQFTKSAGAKGVNELIRKINEKIPEENDKLEKVFANNKKKN